MDAAYARFKGEGMYQRIANLGKFMGAVPVRLSSDNVGQDLATRVWAGLRSGGSVRGRVCFTHPLSGSINWSEEVGWSLSAGRIHADELGKIQVDWKKSEDVSPIGRRLVPMEEKSEDTVLLVGTNFEVWRTKEEFVLFWQDMNNRRIAAYSATLVPSRCNATLIEGTLTKRDLEKLAKPVSDG